MLIIRYAAVLVAAVLLGRWYHSEARRLKASGRPWYVVYFSLPGLIILAVIIGLPIISKMF